MDVLSNIVDKDRRSARKKGTDINKAIAEMVFWRR